MIYHDCTCLSMRDQHRTKGAIRGDLAAATRHPPPRPDLCVPGSPVLEGPAWVSALCVCTICTILFCVCRKINDFYGLQEVLCMYYWRQKS